MFKTEQCILKVIGGARKEMLGNQSECIQCAESENFGKPRPSNWLTKEEQVGKVLTAGRNCQKFRYQWGTFGEILGRLAPKHPW